MADKEGPLRGLAALAAMGATLVAATFTGLVIGLLIDGYLGTGPWFTVIFLVLGIGAGFRQMFAIGKRYGG